MEEYKLKVNDFRNPKRVALSKRYPSLKNIILFTRCSYNRCKLFMHSNYSFEQNEDFFPAVVARHQSPLFRTLGTSDIFLQKNKVVNIAQALKKINGVIIYPGKTFSFWNIVGRPSYKNGYVDGMLLSDGKVVSGVGGGLCQLSNLLYWLFLHSELSVTKRMHHSRDVFPDNARTIPFGSGATIMYNLIDLQIKNTTNYPVQIKIWLTEKQLKVQLLAPQHVGKKFHVYEKNHIFIKDTEEYFRSNEIYRDTLVEGKVTKTEKITDTFAPVLYEVTDEYLQRNKYKSITIEH